MTTGKQIQRYGSLVAVGLLCISLTAAAQAPASDTGAQESGKGPGSYTRPGFPSPSWRGGNERAHIRHHRMAYALKQLNLTDAQRAAIHQIRISTKKNMIQKRADLRIARIELGEQLRKDSVDMSAVEAQVRKIESARTAMKLDAIKARIEVKNTLTPEQRKKLAEVMRTPPNNTVRAGMTG